MGERPLIFAHRGMSRAAPENTLPAFARAIELGVDGVEFDVRLTADKVAVVVHNDELIAHTTTYDFVSRTPWRALQTVDVGATFAPQFMGTRIPTLHEVLECLAPSNLRMNIEIKAQPYWHFGLENLVIQAVQDFRLEDRVVISSFSPLVMLRLRFLASHISRALLVSSRAFFFLNIKLFGRLARVDSLHPLVDIMDHDLVDLAHEHHWRIVPWTVNTREEMERLLSLGVNGIITDEPQLALSVVAGYNYGH